MLTYRDWFKTVTGYLPLDWQEAVVSSSQLQNRLIRIPTGFGKTAGTVLTWLYHRVVHDNLEWPTRLVLVLPMRVLVEQTCATVKNWLSKAQLEGQVDAHLLMGGVEGGDWVLHPERPTVLIGTQDMLLSRALNRGYGAGRARWPMDYGLLHQDSLWVLDEIQLMDTGLCTATQLAAFRAQKVPDQERMRRPQATWWMSATLQPQWLRTADTAPYLDDWGAPLAIPATARQGGLFAVQKQLTRAPQADLAMVAYERHRPGTLSLVIVNTVDRANQVFEQLEKKKGKKKDTGPELRLVHSRFRGQERAQWRESFLNREANIPEAGRIIVATQVVEAGVDISAQLLVTELAPWPSLVQRFGRCARYAGETGQVVVGSAPQTEKDALPYFLAAVQAADQALGQLPAPEVGPAALENFEESLAADFLQQLYPYDPGHVLRPVDFQELFDTAPDLGGAQLDISRYIRSGEDRDLTLFWRDPPQEDAPPPGRDELCPVAVGEAKKWLADKKEAWVHDYQGPDARGKRQKAWIKLDGNNREQRLYPGVVVWVDRKVGGYDSERGFRANLTEAVTAVAAPTPTWFERAAQEEDNDDLSFAQWQTVADHGYQVAQELAQIAESLALPMPWRPLLSLAGRWHDAGKVHFTFQDAIKEEARKEVPLGARRDLAKAPDGSWRRPAYPERPGFRHELASTLALFEVLFQTQPDHPALQGPYQELFGLLKETPEKPDQPLVHPLAEELKKLSADDFDLVAYLVVSHHGKVRTRWAATAKDQMHADSLRIHGVEDGDTLSALELSDQGGAHHPLPDLTLHLDAAAMGVNARYGNAWTARVAQLRRRWGDFNLAYLEALLRAADWRASQKTRGVTP